MTCFRLHFTTILAGLFVLSLGITTQAQDQKHKNGDEHAHSHASASVSETTGVCADLPFGITSFGAVVEDGWLYTYGGNRGTTHKYSTESQNGQILGINLNEKGAKWQELGQGPSLQGLAMVGHNGNLYCMGGLKATNSPDEDQSLVSVSTFSKFNVKTKKWTELPSLPEPRSSHDAVIVGDTIYMMGGWTMDGEDDGEWLEDAYSIDLSKSELKWVKMDVPSFQKRALCVGAHGNKIYAVGGMDDNAQPTCEVSFYDTESKTWLEGPELPAEQGIAGFGSSAFALHGRLYVSMSNGMIVGLNKDDSKWEVVHKLKQARFFPRLVAMGANKLVLVGGTNMRSGKILPVTMLEVKMGSHGHEGAHGEGHGHGSKKK